MPRPMSAAPQRDVVNIGGREGQFKAIRLEVRQSDVEVLDLKIVYGNGDAEDIRVRQMFKAGSSSRVIDLKGGKRAIKQIIVTYVAPRARQDPVLRRREPAACAELGTARLQGCGL